MRWASAISENPALDRGVEEAIEKLRAGLDGAAPDLIALFVSPHHQGAFADAPGLLARHFPNAKLIGCAADGVIGAGHEIERRCAVSVTAAHLPGVELTPFHLETEDLSASAKTGGDRAAWDAKLGLSGAGDEHFLIIPEPFTFDANGFLRELDRVYPRSKKVGGLASGARHAGGSALFLGLELHKRGAVGIAMRGDVEIDTIVAQGCRPIGEPMLITRCEENVLLELGSRKPIEVLRELHDSLDERDRELLQHSLFVGIEMKDQREYHQGDFLIRNIVGVDPQSGAIAIGALPKQWQVVQFHLRDARTSAEDLNKLLDRHKSERSAPEGALLFACLGRGVHLYGKPDHDSGLFADRFGSTPLGGFFCNGEIGPVGETTFLHGYTSSFGLFRSRQG